MIPRLLPVPLRLSRFAAPRRSGSVLVMPSAAAGSLGDQAMLDVTLKVIAERGYHPMMLTSRDRYSLRTGYTPVPVSGGTAARVITLFRDMMRVERMAFIGADVINDQYVSTRRLLDILIAAERAGIETSIQGYSLSEAPGETSLRQLRSLPRTHMHLRDVNSLERFGRLVRPGGVLTADAALLLEPEARAASARGIIARIRAWRGAGCQVLGFNAGGPVLGEMQGGISAGTEAYRQVLSRWLDGDPARRIVMVPHDFRPGVIGDLEPLQWILEKMAPGLQERIAFLAPPYDAWDVKAIAAELDFVLTARMHFAIACAGSGTPALGLAYMGKFEGLMQHFAVEQAVSPPSDLLQTDSFLGRLEAFGARAPALRRQMQARLPEVHALSWRNFDWLPARQGAQQGTRQGMTGAPAAA